MAKSIMHNKADRTCYLCMKLRRDYSIRTGLQEHHVMSGTANRKLSEEYGLKVYLCLEHHTAGPEAVHNNAGNRKMLMKEAQSIFEKKYSHEKWMEIFGRNYNYFFGKIDTHGNCKSDM